MNTANPVLLPQNAAPPQALIAGNITPHIVTAQSTPLKIQTELIDQVPVTVPPPETREDSPLKPNARSSSIPPPSKHHFASAATCVASKASEISASSIHDLYATCQQPTVHNPKFGSSSSFQGPAALIGYSKTLLPTFANPSSNSTRGWFRYCSETAILTYTQLSPDTLTARN